MLRPFQPMFGWIRLLPAIANRGPLGFVPLAVASVAFSTPPVPPPVSWDPAPTAVVASFRERLGEVADDDPGPSIELFGDGRLAVHFPRYMRRAGEWTDRLMPPEIRQLLGALVGDGVLDLEPDALRGRLARARGEQRAAALRGDAMVFEASDPSTTEVTLRANGRERTVVWRGTRADAWAHPDLPDLQRLARAHDQLRALAERPALRRLP